ncbi:nuclear transport factor 2 family protein [Shimazuella alba]|uniref:DUF4440 domain-containing protein n=1 Tax=Shimazuella alba TaxID=2690964 RepID=A0A6I4W4E7_9BACL|nr:nuclear transport factor 2 family protein [Shimazuella alba]MXQ55182.1 hypothetical protein [Shimazuella alba]
MNKSHMRLVITMMMLFLITACTATSQTEKELEQVVEDNLQAMNEKDFTKYMDMLSKDTDPNVVTQTEKTMEYAFSNLDLVSTVKRFKAVSISGDTAIIEVEQDTINKKSDPRFKNNRTIAEHTMVKENNQWKFKSTVIRSTKQIDSSGNVIGNLQ